MGLNYLATLTFHKCRELKIEGWGRGEIAQEYPQLKTNGNCDFDQILPVPTCVGYAMFAQTVF